MSEQVGPTRSDTPGDDSPGDSTTLQAVYPRSCTRCQSDLSNCSSAARFCPRCGESLAVQATQTAPTPPLFLPPPLPVLSFQDGPTKATTHSLILGYANAMFRLGWRYEQGQGASRNVEEAARCYFKAAKLGNAAARARLGPKSVDYQGMEVAGVTPGAAAG